MSLDMVTVHILTKDTTRFRTLGMITAHILTNVLTPAVSCHNMICHHIPCPNNIWVFCQNNYDL